jgi:hypothetical protein
MSISNSPLARAMKVAVLTARRMPLSLRRPM